MGYVPLIVKVFEALEAHGFLDQSHQLGSNSAFPGLFWAGQTDSCLQLGEADELPNTQGWLFPVSSCWPTGQLLIALWLGISHWATNWPL